MTSQFVDRDALDYNYKFHNSAHVEGSWRFTTHTMYYLILSYDFRWGRKPECPETTSVVKQGPFNSTDMPDGSGQQLRMATIVPRPSRLTTWPASQHI